MCARAGRRLDSSYIVMVVKVMITPAQRKHRKCKIGRRDSERKARYWHGLLTHDNENPMFCVIAYAHSKKLRLVQNSICMYLVDLNLWIFYR
jgi:hypothetical protein